MKMIGSFASIGGDVIENNNTLNDIMESLLENKSLT